MNRTLPTLLAAFLMLVLGAVALPACAAEPKIPASVAKALQESKTFELYSLNPNVEDKPDDTNFQGWKILGKTSIDDAKTRASLVAALQKGVADNTDGIIAACFMPRHGIRLSHRGKTIDIVICFQCYSSKVFIDGKPTEGFIHTDSPRDTFNKVLKDAKVELPKGIE